MKRYITRGILTKIHEMNPTNMMFVVEYKDRNILITTNKQIEKLINKKDRTYA